MNTPPEENELIEFFDHREKFLEEERKRIAQEIHDDLGQRLVAMRLEVASMRRSTFNDEKTRLEKIDSIMKQVDGAFQSIRSLVNNIRPSVLNLGLTASLQWQASDFMRSTGIPCSFETNCEDIVLSDEVSTTIFRLLQEALTNVTKHAHAKHVYVQLNKSDNNELILTIRDDGIGIPSKRDRTHKTYGITGMHERIMQIGGTLTIAQANPGTLLTFKMPLQN